MKESKFKLHIKKKYFAVRVVRPWIMLSKELVNAPSLEVWEAGLGGDLSHLVKWKMSLPIAGWLELDDL